MQFRRLAYTSSAKTEFNKRLLLDLLHDSRAYNTIDNISGVLIHKQGFFLQVIEGEPEAVNNLLKRLMIDPRHHKLKIIYDCSADKRLFSNWAMGCADFDQPELSMMPGILQDLTNPNIIEELISRLPEIAALLRKTLNYQQING